VHLGSNEVKMKPSTLTCDKVTFLANYSTFSSLVSLATSRVTSSLLHDDDGFIARY